MKKKPSHVGRVPSPGVPTPGVQKAKSPSPGYRILFGDIRQLLESARRASARTVNSFMTAAYWEVGRHIVNFEQGGQSRAGYGQELLKQLSNDLTKRFGRGFGTVNLSYMKRFYLLFPPARIFQTLSEKSTDPTHETTSPESGSARKSEALSRKSGPAKPRPKAPGKSLVPFALPDLARAFPLPWSQYVLLISRSRSPEAFDFYHTEALRGGWSVRQLQRQMDSQFYERAALSRNKAAMLAKGAQPLPEDVVSADEEIRHPLVLEFLGLRDEYSETDLEDALVRHLEHFLLELGNDFAFIGRQRRLRIGLRRPLTQHAPPRCQSAACKSASRPRGRAKHQSGRTLRTFRPLPDQTQSRMNKTMKPMHDVESNFSIPTGLHHPAKGCGGGAMPGYADIKEINTERVLSPALELMCHPPSGRDGGIGKMCPFFGERLDQIIAEPDEALAA